jgi:hypothetical protein
MSAAILTAICSHPQVKGALRFTALNIAYKCNAAHIGRVAYSYLAKRTGLHVRTIMRHVAKLVELGVLRKTVTRLSSRRCMLNLYEFIVPKRASDKARPIKRSGENPLTREEEIRNMRWGLAHLWEEGSIQYTECLNRLNQLLQE